jgi:pimeloyl-ACP methyl ester carboxylesterase
MHHFLEGRKEMKQTKSYDGTQITFWHSGTGDPLLLVHGATADHKRWSSILPRLEPHFSVYVMDRRGRGASSDSPDYHLLREAEDVAAVVETIGAEVGKPIFVLGHSYGATCSLEASLLTDKIRRLVLYEPGVPGIAPLIPPGVPDRMQALIDIGESEVALEVFMREVVRMPEHELAVYRQLPMWQTRISIAATIPRELAFDRTYSFQTEKFANMTVPTMLLLGGDSPPFARQAAEHVKATLPDSQIVVLPGQQHIAMDTAPDLFASAVLHFLAEARVVSTPVRTLVGKR